ncbi:carboxymuconolactone decarboxylase family protein [Pseudomonas palleroniana]|uniref:Alkylhydroperoxidase AhpD family core domain-containing protein n=1 Tax=Pseudomonas palleroniana TaxID=191390 RepID=A0A1H5P0Y6_9PSED|nr:carboxymuconolactone decarboxylase family protein [Pseudomonas palleroniana]KAB0569229.1 carboxymuconolactone decarboxylase family protein [Pseudomonas palleroniana]PTC28012.1 carboxymuconolactone decarboxylase family protein [Pseudomonas palleroniana]SEF07569.1 alkylhydroperoxidase AhpD family core domain-containing protein [Pseudomonas palleroniana]
MKHRLDYAQAAPAGYSALGSVHRYIHGCGLEKELIDLVYLRVSQLNGCAYCLDSHSRDLLKQGIDLEKLMLVAAWHEASPLFTPRECAALAWAEVVTQVAQTQVPDADYTRVSALFNDKEVADLTLAIALMNALNRVAISFRKVPAAVKAHRVNQDHE